MAKDDVDGVTTATVLVRVPEWLADMCREVGKRRDSKNRESMGEVLVRYAGKAVAAEYKKLPPLKARAGVGG